MYVNYVELGRRIAKRRKELGLKQSQVNEMAGLSDKYLSNIERATSVLSLDVFMKLCTVLETTPDYLLLGTANDIPTQDYEKIASQKMHRMTDKQIQLALSLMDWIQTQDL